MSLVETIKLGMAIPQAFVETPVDIAMIRRVSQRSEEVGFESLWTSSGIFGGVPILEPLSLLNYVAGFTSTVRLGVSVLVFPLYSPVSVAKAFASLDQVSGGRAIVGLGLGSRTDPYEAFGLTPAGRVKRFEDGIEVMKSLWSEPTTDYHNEYYHLKNAKMEPKPLQRPHPPIWLGGGHPNVLQRAVRIADGWMGAGSSSNASFKERVFNIKDMLAETDRDPKSFTISKRVYISVDDDESKALQHLRLMSGELYNNPRLADEMAVWGSPQKCIEILNDLALAGVDHLLLHPVTDFEEQLEALAEISKAD